jgi:hypothetical protein
VVVTRLDLFRRESGCIVYTPLMKSGLVILHLLFLCAASSSAVNTGEIYLSIGISKSALSLSSGAEHQRTRAVHPDCLRPCPGRDEVCMLAAQQLEL